MKAIKLRGKTVHYTTNTVLSGIAGVTFWAHFVAPHLEALGFLLAGVLAVWANDLERIIRHPHYHLVVKKEAD